MKTKSRVKSRSKPRRAAAHHGASQVPRQPECMSAKKVDVPSITSRDDLPFIARDDHDCIIDWQPIRHFPDVDQGRRVGFAYAEAVCRLADVDEYEAYIAIKRVLLSSNWDVEAGEEHGFIESLVRTAIIGMRARKSEEALPFDTRFEPEHSRHCSLLEQVDVMKAQFKSMSVKPWRTYAEAGMA
jgi:hypothetical protein